MQEKTAARRPASPPAAPPHQSHHKIIGFRAKFSRARRQRSQDFPRTRRRHGLGLRRPNRRPRPRLAQIEWILLPSFVYPHSHCPFATASSYRRRAASPGAAPRGAASAAGRVVTASAPADERVGHTLRRAARHTASWPTSPALPPLTAYGGQPAASTRSLLQPRVLWAGEVVP